MTDRRAAQREARLDANLDANLDASGPLRLPATSAGAEEKVLNRFIRPMLPRPDQSPSRRGTMMSRLPLVAIADTTPDFSICSSSLAARL